MGKAWTVKVTGVKPLMRGLDNYMKSSKTAANNNINRVMKDIARQAKSNLPKPLKSVSGSISVTFESVNSNVTSFEVLVSYATAAYIEFGTGNYAATYVPGLPEEWQAYAKTFFINGKGRTPATPFLYPAWIANKENLLDAVKKAFTR